MKQLVKPYVKRGKNDMADAEALCEAMSRPTMRFVPIKTAEQQFQVEFVPVDRPRRLISKIRISVMSSSDPCALHGWLGRSIH